MIRSIQTTAVLIILFGSVCGFLNEVYIMFITQKVDLAYLYIVYIC